VAPERTTDQFVSGAVHYAVSTTTNYSRSVTATPTYTTNPGIALGAALANISQANSAVQRLAETLPEPQADPARQLALSIFQSLAARPNITRGQSLRPGQSGDPEGLAAQARARGLSGALINVSMVEVRIYGSGAAAQIGGNRVVVGLHSTISLIDIASGAVLAQSNCQENRRTRRADVEANPTGFTTREVNALVQICAAGFLGLVR